MSRYKLMQWCYPEKQFNVVAEYHDNDKAHNAAHDLRQWTVGGLMHENGNWVITPNGYWETETALTSYNKREGSTIVWNDPDQYVRMHYLKPDAVFTVRTFDAKGNHFDEPDAIFGWENAKAYADAKTCPVKLFLKGCLAYGRR